MSKFKWLIRNIENIAATIAFIVMGGLILWIYLFKTELTWFGRLVLIPSAIILAFMATYFILKWFDELKRWAEK